MPASLPETEPPTANPVDVPEEVASPVRSEPTRLPPLELQLGRATVPLGFVLDSDRLWLVARERSARWPTEVLRDGWADVRLPDRHGSGPAALVVDRAERDRILARFRSKYGSDQFERWYQNPARVVQVDLAVGASSRPTAPDYAAWLRGEFDNVAEEYDRHIFGNRINRLLRERSLALLRGTFGSAHRLLEVGCGSGTETLPLLQDGHEITCVDISERMLEVVRAKARRDGVSERLRTVRSSAGAWARGSDELAAGPFDGAYSTYGALNCEADLAPVARSFHRCTVPNAPIVAGVFNRWCAFELVGYSLVGKWGRAFGRSDQPVEVGTSRFCVDVFAYSPQEFADRFRPWWRPVFWEASPLFLPPSDLVQYAEKFSRRFDKLERWDHRLSRLPYLRSLGDHFLMVLTRQESPISAP